MVKIHYVFAEDTSTIRRVAVRRIENAVPDVSLTVCEDGAKAFTEIENLRDAWKAIEKPVERSQQFYVIASDNNMPEKNGLDILAEVLKEFPKEFIQQCRFCLWSDRAGLDGTLSEELKQRVDDKVGFDDYIEQGILNFVDDKSYDNLVAWFATTKTKLESVLEPDLESKPEPVSDSESKPKPKRKLKPMPGPDEGAAHQSGPAVDTVGSRIVGDNNTQPPPVTQQDSALSLGEVKINPGPKPEHVEAVAGVAGTFDVKDGEGASPHMESKSDTEADYLKAVYPSPETSGSTAYVESDSKDVGCGSLYACCATFFGKWTNRVAPVDAPHLNDQKGTSSDPATRKDSLPTTTPPTVQAAMSSTDSMDELELTKQQP